MHLTNLSAMWFGGYVLTISDVYYLHISKDKCGYLKNPKLICLYLSGKIHTYIPRTLDPVKATN
jgi:hypothetical protein